MVTLLFTSIFIIGFLAVALYFWQKPGKSSERAALPPLPPPRGLFNDPDTAESPASETTSVEAEEQRALLLERARGGDRSALDEGHNLRDKELYDQLLNLLAAAADSDSSLLSLVSYVARNDLPVNNNLARAVLESWKKTPDRNSTAKALHITALADDAALYQEAVEFALRSWRKGELENVSPVELQALFDGEFWVLSSRTRGSGSGFILKRTLANARRELGNAAGINQ